MSLTIEDVRHIAQLARLSLTADEEARYQVQLSAILDYAARLRAVDTSAISPTASMLPIDAPLRPDEARPSAAGAQILARTPETTDGMFRIPPVFP